MKLSVQKELSNEYLDNIKTLDEIQCLFFGDSM